jgi:predicted RNase H-like HicB family nuclease
LNQRFETYSKQVTTKHELLQLTPTFEQVEGGWTQAGLRELPGVITAAPSLEEARDMLMDALREFLLSFGENLPAAAAPPAGGWTFTLSVESTPAA